MCRKRKMNMRVTKAEVIKTASDMADRNGLHNVSLKAIAENLGIRTPSLYNHIGSLDELLREIAHSGMRTMNEKMIRAAIGKTGDSALKLVAVEYLNYMIEHPGVYEIIQWASWNGTEETAIIFNDYLSLLKTLNLRFGAIDFILDKKGNYIFLEINPNGQWAWIEKQTGYEISNEITNLLEYECF